MMLGNLSLETMEQRAGVIFPEAFKSKMSGCRQENVSIPIAIGKWHCFDMPFCLVCGGKELQMFVAEQLSPLGADFKQPLSVGYTDEED